MLDSVHASMVLYIQEVRGKQNKENKKNTTRRPRKGERRTPRRQQPNEERAWGRNKKKKVAGVTARLMSPRGGETKNKGGR